MLNTKYTVGVFYYHCPGDNTVQLKKKSTKKEPEGNMGIYLINFLCHVVPQYYS